MAAKRRKPIPSPPDDVPFSLRDRDQIYTNSELCDLLEKAAALGFSLGPGSELERLTVRELDNLVNRKQ